MPLSLAAAEKPAQLKGEWGVTMLQDEKKSFAYCLARAPYTNGLQLAIALSPKREVNVGVMVPEGGFTNGDKYPMAVTVDKIFRREHPGVAAQPELIMVPLGPDKEILSALEKGKTLSVEGPADIATFNLRGAGKALASLRTCVDVGTGKIKAPRPEKLAAGGKGGKPVNFPPSLLHLLKDAGLKDLRIVPIPDPEKAPVDFAWQTEGVLGGLRERPVPADTTLEKMSGMIEGSYKKQCGGTFHSSFSNPEELPGVRLRTADISCEMAEKKAHVALLLYLTDTHLFSMFMHETEVAKKEIADYARDAIAQVIRRLAKEQKASTAPAPPAPAAPSVAAPSMETAPSSWAAPDSAPPSGPSPAPAPAQTKTK